MDDIERLRNWLDEHHLSASRFADELGYSKAQISLVLNRHRPLSDRLRWQFSLRYGVDQAQAVFRGGTGAEKNIDFSNKYK